MPIFTLWQCQRIILSCQIGQIMSVKLDKAPTIFPPLPDLPPYPMPPLPPSCARLRHANICVPLFVVSVPPVCDDVGLGASMMCSSLSPLRPQCHRVRIVDRVCLPHHTSQIACVPPIPHTTHRKDRVCASHIAHHALHRSCLCPTSTSHTNPLDPSHPHDASPLSAL